MVATRNSAVNISEIENSILGLLAEEKYIRSDLCDILELGSQQCGAILDNLLRKQQIKIVEIVYSKKAKRPVNLYASVVSLPSSDSFLYKLWGGWVTPYEKPHHVRTIHGGQWG